MFTFDILSNDPVKSVCNVKMIYGEHLDNVLKSSSGLRWRFGRHRRAWDEVAAGRSKPFFPFLLLHTWGHFTGRTLKMPGQNGIFCAFEHFTALRTLNKREGGCLGRFERFPELYFQLDISSGLCLYLCSPPIVRDSQSMSRAHVLQLAQRTMDNWERWWMRVGQERNHAMSTRSTRWPS